MTGPSLRSLYVVASLRDNGQILGSMCFVRAEETTKGCAGWLGIKAKVLGFVRFTLRTPITMLVPLILLVLSFAGRRCRMTVSIFVQSLGTGSLGKIEVEFHRMLGSWEQREHMLQGRIWRSWVLSENWY